MRDLLVAPDFGHAVAKSALAGYERSAGRLHQNTIMTIGILLVHAGEWCVAEANARED